MKPTLLLLHGLLNDERVWEPVASRLRRRADILVPNLRRQDSIAQMSRDAWADVAGLPHDTPLVLAGFSMGGYVAQQMLADAPRRVAALALVDTSCRPEPPENVPVREATMAALQRDIGAETLAILRRGVHADQLSNAPLMALGQRIMREVGAAAAIRQIQAIIGRADHRAMLARLDMPTLVLCGRTDQVTPLALSREHRSGADPGRAAAHRRRRRPLGADGAAAGGGRRAGPAARCRRLIPFGDLLH
jgi:pimeloyl-ACP methyl ester carboxylesterase